MSALEDLNLANINTKLDTIITAQSENSAADQVLFEAMIGVLEDIRTLLTP